MIKQMKQLLDARTFANARVTEIKNEYAKIDNDWLVVHFKITFYMALTTLLVEILLSFYVIQTQLRTTPVSLYFLKYVIVPTILNSGLLIIGYKLIKTQRYTSLQKIYGISIIATFVAFVITSIHNIYSPIYMIYLISIVLTSIYSNHNLTRNMSCLSIVLFLLSEFVIVWDPIKQSIFESPLRLVSIILIFITLLLFSVTCIISMDFLRKKNTVSINLEIERYELEHRLRFDELTGIYNRMTLNATLNTISEKHNDNYFIMAMADLDHFKKINDQFGHHLGDLCLKAFAEALKDVSPNSLAFRFGGDEFCLLFQDISMNDAIVICQIVQSKLTDIQLDESTTFTMHASFGLAEFSPTISVTELFLRADSALYEAKEKRNMVTVFSQK